jgi:HK97 family phage portal protein
MHGSAVITCGLSAPQVERASNPLLDDGVWSTKEEWNDFTSLDGGEQAAGVRVNTRTALGYAPFWRAVTLMGSDMGSFPIAVYKRVKTKWGEGKERDRKHPANVINRRPNRYMSRYTFIQTLIIHAGRKGNGYAYVRRDGGGRPKELLILAPESTWPVRRNGVLWYVTEVNGKLLRLEAEDVIHIKGPGDDGLQGYDVLSYAKKTLGLALATREHRIVYFKNGAKPAVVLEAPGQIPPKVLKRLKSQWQSLYAGVSNHHRTAILQMGTSAKTLTQNARDSQLIEGQELDVYHISAITGVPPHKIGGRGRGGYASLEAENEAYMSDCIAHLVTACEQEFADKLLTEKEKRNETHTIEILTAAKVKANLLTRMQAYAFAINARVMIPNEAREKEGLPPTEWGSIPVDNQKSANGGTGGGENPPNESQIAEIVKKIMAESQN